MEQLINLVVENGLSVVCVCYLIYFQQTTMSRMLDTLGGIDKRLALIEEKLKNSE